MILICEGLGWLGFGVRVFMFKVFGIWDLDLELQALIQGFWVSFQVIVCEAVCWCVKVQVLVYKGVGVGVQTGCVAMKGQCAKVFEAEGLMVMVSSGGDL